MNLSHTESTQTGKKVTTSKLGPLVEVVIWGEKVDISETTINKFLHGQGYTAPTMVGLYEVHHHSVTS